MYVWAVVGLERQLYPHSHPVPTDPLYMCTCCSLSQFNLARNECSELAQVQQNHIMLESACSSGTIHIASLSSLQVSLAALCPQ